MARIVTPPMINVPADADPGLVEPSGRRKLPAYGKALMLERRQGRHPREITLVYGDDWHAGDAPRICIRPSEYEPVRYDFRVCAGVQVRVLDQVMGAAERAPYTRPTSWGKFYDLLRELTEARAAVTVQWPQQSGWPSMSVSMMALADKWGRAWPSWWSAELQARADAAMIGALEDGFKLLERQLPQPQGERAEAA